MPVRAAPVLCLALAACQCAAPGEILVGTSGLANAGDFPGAAALLDGFDAAGDAPWRAGDEVLFGLQLRRGSAVQRWLLHLRLTEPVAIARTGGDAVAPSPLPPLQWTFEVAGAPMHFTSAPCRALATVCDANGNVLGRSEPVLPREFLARGFAEACEQVMAWLPGSHDAGDVDRFMHEKQTLFATATLTAVALLQIVQDDEVLAPLLWQVIEKPSVWSVVTNFGVRVTLQPQFCATVHADRPAIGGAVPWRLPMSLLVNDQPALQTVLFVAPAVRPLALCGGIVGIVARHPQDPAREASVLLLAARCGRNAR